MRTTSEHFVCVFVSVLLVGIGACPEENVTATDEDGEQDIIAETRGYNMSEWDLYQQSSLGWDADSPTPQNPELSHPEAGDYRQRQARVRARYCVACQGS